MRVNHVDVNLGLPWLRSSRFDVSLIISSVELNSDTYFSFDTIRIQFIGNHLVIKSCYQVELGR